MPTTLPSATSSDGTSAVGALFTVGASGIGSHFCTASVVDSPGGDLAVTAAHCVSGPATNIVFIPGYHDGRAPYGVWTVTRVIVDQAWKSSADPDDDFALLVVEKAGSRARLEDVTGGERLGIGEPDGQLVRVTGYPNGKEAPITCENRARKFSTTQLEFDCAGYTDGTSGSPLLADVDPATGLGTVIGVIGGYEQGGDTPEVSYAANFGSKLATLFTLATTVAAG